MSTLRRGRASVAAKLQWVQGRRKRRKWARGLLLYAILICSRHAPPYSLSNSEALINSCIKSFINYTHGTRIKEIRRMNEFEHAEGSGLTYSELACCMSASSTLSESLKDFPMEMEGTHMAPHTRSN